MLNKSLSIIIGPMYSGKTSKLFEIFNFNNINNENQLIIDYTFIKEDLLQITNLYNHDKNYLSCIKFNSRLLKNYNYYNYKYIHINEAQFFPNLKEIILYILEKYNIHIYCYGLDSDYKKEKFGELIDLIPHCDNIIKLSGRCNNPNIVCNNKSVFSHRIDKTLSQKIILTNSTDNNYISLCRICYNSFNK